MENTMLDKVNTVLETIRPMLIADGGNVDLVSVEDGIVKLKLKGACGSCPMSQMTLRMGIERELKRQIPEVTQVLAV
jgi:Fe-S cluster biogenesis protein NfuA